MRILKAFLILFFLLNLPVISMAEEAEEFPNPHWAEDEKLCLECHDIVPRRGSGILNLKYEGDIIAVCIRCHGLISRDKSIHATGMVPSKDMHESSLHS